MSNKKHRPLPLIKCLKPLDDWNPAQGETIMRRLWQEFAKAAKTTPYQLRRAYSRIVFDGYYGPVDDREWYHSEGYSMTIRRARQLLRAALEHNPYVAYYHPEVGFQCNGINGRYPDGRDACCHQDHQDTDEPGPMFHEEEVVVDPDQIKREMFHGLIEIYGHLSI